MNPLQIPAAADRLASNAAVFRHLLAGVGPAQARWKPAPTAWSILEVVNHLADEERLDFRRRLGLTLSDPGAPWPPIDPPAWVEAHGYNERDLPSSLEDFLAERTRSIAWLRGLDAPDLTAFHDHPRMGRLTAGDLLASWLAHDLLHLRQLTRLHYQYLADAPYAVAYAGTW